jgi:hypothetical protein
LMMAITIFIGGPQRGDGRGRAGVTPGSARGRDQNVLLTWTTNVPLPSSLHEPFDWHAE